MATKRPFSPGGEKPRAATRRRLEPESPDPLSASPARLPFGQFVAAAYAGPSTATSTENENTEWIARRQDLTFDSSPYSTRPLPSSPVRLLPKSKAKDNMLASEVERCELLRRIRRGWGGCLWLELDEMVSECTFVFGECFRMWIGS